MMEPAVSFAFVKRVDTPTYSIFYSFIKHNGEIMVFGRKHYDSNKRVIKKITSNEQFDIVEDNAVMFRGEDPRCFEYNGKLYILDNYYNDMFLIEYETKKYTKINISGKNITFLHHDGVLYFIHYIKPFVLCTFNPETGDIQQVEVDDDRNQYNLEYRGGTPGYRLSENSYYGFGHRTYTQDGLLKHDVFRWVVHFEPGKKPRISHYDITQPPGSKNICDPTSVIEINNRKFLITAESDASWFCDQDYVTNVYEILEPI